MKATSLGSLGTLFAALLVGCGDSDASPPTKVLAASTGGDPAPTPQGTPEVTPEPETPAAPAPPPRRIRLFDHMDDARLANAPSSNNERAQPSRHLFDFDQTQPDEIFYGKPSGRSVDYDVDNVGVVDASGGREGAGLRLGPDLPEDRSQAVVFVPAAGRARVTVTGRVKLEGNPKSEDSSSREVLRVIEHSSVVDRPTRSRGGWRRPRPRRVSRRIDPSGWDRFEVSFISGSSTESLEVQLLHRSGNSAEAVTRFDDVSVETTKLTEAEIYEHLRARYRPDDGNEDATPWRSRISLSSADGRRRSEVRDAVILPPPTQLEIPVRLPPKDIKPTLRFQYGMPQEAHNAKGDGARLEVRFAPDEGEEVAIGQVDVDPKNDRAQRRWQIASFDLSAVAGREGKLVFASVDDPGDEDDELDAVVLSTPRIEPAEEAPGTFNVLLIGVDTLRADRMSVFGYERPTTPNLDKLGDEGVRFMNTRSQAPWTLPSFSSILTSLYPSTHGAGRGGHDEWTPIDPNTTSIAEVLSRVGYETQGIVANGLISPAYGLDQGFEGYQSAWAMESVGRDTESVEDYVTEHRTTPWMLFWHIMDPHLPYSTRENFRDEYTAEDYDGQFSRGRGSVPFQVLDPRPGRRWYAHEGPPPAPDLSDDDRRYVHDYYDAEIAETDEAIGRVLEAIKKSGQWDRTIVALVADHGEGLGDHDHYHHGYTLFDDQVHIPMLLRIPGKHVGRVVDRPVASIDLAPTILGALGMEPPEFFAGVDRLAEDAPQDDAYFMEYPTYDSSAQKGWVLGAFKYFHDPLFHTEALYNIEKDPGEKTDVKAQHPDIVARARKEMDAFRWNEQQKGRFHMRLRGEKGQRLVVKVSTNDLFDANFVTRPQRPEKDFTMDLARQNFVLSTVLAEEQLELLFWCRGNNLGFDITLDGEPVGMQFGESNKGKLTPFETERTEIPTAEGNAIPWPNAAGTVIWLEAGVSQVLPVVLSPEEIERLQELGYTK